MPNTTLCGEGGGRAWLVFGMGGYVEMVIGVLARMIEFLISGPCFSVSGLSSRRF